MTGLRAGEFEDFKGAYHNVLGKMAAGACGYNSAAFCVRREPHLFVNAIVYFVLWRLERRKVDHHAARTRTPQ